MIAKSLRINAVRENLRIYAVHKNLRINALHEGLKLQINDKAKKKGYREFQKRWGGRFEPEDNWRRSNRASVSINDNIADASSYEEALTDEEISQMLAGVPSSEAERQKANEMIMTALFELGTLYRDRLKNNRKSVETLEQLNKRYPDNRHELESWYFLYLAYSDLGDNRKKKEYFDKNIDCLSA